MLPLWVDEMRFPSGCVIVSGCEECRLWMCLWFPMYLEEAPIWVLMG